MKRSILLILFVLLIAGQTAQSQTEEFNNQQKVNIVQNQVMYLMNNYFVENDNEEFVVFSEPAILSTGFTGHLIMTYYDFGLNIIHHEQFGLDEYYMVDENASPRDFIYDGDDTYIGCGNYFSFDTADPGTHRECGFVFRQSSGAPGTECLH